MCPQAAGDLRLEEVRSLCAPPSLRISAQSATGRSARRHRGLEAARRQVQTATRHCVLPPGRPRIPERGAQGWSSSVVMQGVRNAMAPRHSARVKRIKARALSEHGTVPPPRLASPRLAMCLTLCAAQSVSARTAQLPPPVAGRKTTGATTGRGARGCAAQSCAAHSSRALRNLFAVRSLLFRRKRQKPSGGGGRRRAGEQKFAAKVRCKSSQSLRTRIELLRDRKRHKLIELILSARARLWQPNGPAGPSRSRSRRLVEGKAACGDRQRQAAGRNEQAAATVALFCTLAKADWWWFWPRRRGLKPLGCELHCKQAAVGATAASGEAALLVRRSARRTVWLWQNKKLGLSAAKVNRNN